MSNAVNPTIFRAYDIRGVVDADLSEAVYHTLGRAAGTYFRARNPGRERSQPSLPQLLRELRAMLRLGVKLFT